LEDLPRLIQKTLPEVDLPHGSGGEGIIDGLGGDLYLILHVAGLILLNAGRPPVQVIGNPVLVFPDGGFRLRGGFLFSYNFRLLDRRLQRLLEFRNPDWDLLVHGIQDQQLLKDAKGFVPLASLQEEFPQTLQGIKVLRVQGQRRSEGCLGFGGITLIPQDPSQNHMPRHQLRMPTQAILQKAPSLRIIPSPPVHVGKRHEAPPVRVGVGPIEFLKFPDLGFQALFQQAVLGGTGKGGGKGASARPASAGPKIAERFRRCQRKERLLPESKR